MDKINWVQKLSSRKFWACIVAFITPILFMLNIAETTIENITAIIMSCGGLIAYILAEGYVDSKRETPIDFIIPEEYSVGFKSNNE